MRASIPCYLAHRARLARQRCPFSATEGSPSGRWSLAGCRCRVQRDWLSEARPSLAHAVALSHAKQPGFERSWHLGGCDGAADVENARRALAGEGHRSVRGACELKQAWASSTSPLRAPFCDAQLPAPSLTLQGEYLMARSFVQEETHPRAHRQRQRHALERKWARATGTSTTVRAAFTAGAVPSAEIQARAEVYLCACLLTGSAANLMPPCLRSSQALEDSIAVALGARKRNRWHNDRLLRDLAGPLTAAEMRGLYSPVPFGEPRRTAFAAAADPQHRDVWDMFRSIDPDRQRRVLDAWGQRGPRDKHAKAETRGCWGPAERWARVPRTQRAALRKAAPGEGPACHSPSRLRWLARMPHPWTPRGPRPRGGDRVHRAGGMARPAPGRPRVGGSGCLPPPPGARGGRIPRTEARGRGRHDRRRGAGPGARREGRQGGSGPGGRDGGGAGGRAAGGAGGAAAGGGRGGPGGSAPAPGDGVRGEAPAVDVQMEGHEAVVTQGGCFQEACVGTGGGPGWPEGHAEAPSPGSRSDGSDGSWEVVTDEEAAGLPGEAAWGGERGRWAGARGALRFLPGFLP